jgi:hypothetical protein
MLYLPLTKAWIISKPAKYVYLLASVLALALFAFVIAMFFAYEFLGREAVRGSSAFALLNTAIVLPGVLASALIWVAMWYHWFQYYRPDGSRGISFVLLLALGWLGAALYFFFVYARTPEVVALRQEPNN